MEEKENSREPKRLTCDNIKCPCMKAARRLKPKPLVGKGKHERLWFTDEQELEWGWDANEPAYKDCCHYQVDEKGHWIVGTKTKGKGQQPTPPSNPLKPLLIVLGIIVAVIVVIASLKGCGGGVEDETKEPAKTGTGEAEAVRYLQRVINESLMGL